MKNIIQLFILIGFCCWSSDTAIAQSSVKIQMTPAEYQSLMETILTAKKRRIAKRKRYYYQAHQAQRNNKQQSVASQQTTTKIEQLEQVYERILQQQKTDRNNEELAQVKSNLEKEMGELRSQLETEKSEKDILANQYRDRSDLNNDDLKSRNRQLEAELNNLSSQQDLLAEALKRSNSRIAELQRQEINDNRLLENTDEDVTELQKQIRSLEKQQNTLLILSQAQPKTKGDTSANFSAAYIASVSKDLAAMELKIEQLEAKNVAAPVDNSDNQLLIKDLQDKITALEKRNPVATTSPDYSQDFAAIQTKLAAMEQELKAHNHGNTTPIIINTPTPPPAPVPVIAPAPKEDIKTFVTSRKQQNVYFANGSTNLNPTEQNKVREIANWLSTYELLDITIKGYASNVGSFEVNQRISQQRAATVKQALLNLGVQSNRIILVPLGIDTTSTDPANARRAEIHLLIRE